MTLGAAREERTGSSIKAWVGDPRCVIIERERWSIATERYEIQSQPVKSEKMRDS